MAYFNFEQIKKNGLGLKDVVLLQFLFQNSFEDLSETLKKFKKELQKAEKKGFVKINKTPKSKSIYHRYRLSKKGSDLYKSIQLKDVEPEDISLCDYLSDLWISYDLKVGNKSKCVKYLAQFFAETGFSRRAVFNAVRDYYLEDMYRADKMKYVPKLDNFIWKPSNVYSNKFKLEESRLYEYISSEFLGKNKE
jgi:hypothetical protein